MTTDCTGGDNNLAVVLGTYHLPVSCRGTFPSWQSCRDIIYDMPASKLPQVFGPRDDPAVTEDLPYNIDSCTNFSSPGFRVTCSNYSSSKKKPTWCVLRTCSVLASLMWLRFTTYGKP